MPWLVAACCWVLAAAAVVVPPAEAACQPSRPPVSQRRFVSAAVEAFISDVQRQIDDPGPARWPCLLRG